MSRGADEKVGFPQFRIPNSQFPIPREQGIPNSPKEKKIMRYPTYEEIMAKETGDKIRECALQVCPPVTPRCSCKQYDRPIVCAEKKEFRPGIIRCSKFKSANIDYLQKFEGRDGNSYAFAWNKDLRKYVIYKNNKAMQKFSMDSIGYAYQIYWELSDKWSKELRRRR